MVNLMELTERYRRAFGGSRPTLWVRAPGRVNLIGEHTDYNDGFVLPIAMSQTLNVLAGPGGDDDVVVHATSFSESVRFPVRDPGPPGLPKWANYVRGVAALLGQAVGPLTGGRLLIHSTVPIGGGVSSSAALEVGTAFALLGLAGYTMDPIELALLARQAEHTYAGAPCGIMDQFICVLGKAEHALLLDCRSRTYEQLLLSLPGSALVVCDTQVRHELGASQYPIRQQQCREGLDALRASHPQMSALRDATPEILEAHRDGMAPVTYRRCRHVVSEIARTLRAADALRANDLESFGRLMSESHASLRDDYAVSCAELDKLVEIAAGVEGVWGARMTGGGFGGCAIVLLRESAVDSLRRAIARDYDPRFSKPALVYTTAASDGAIVQVL